MPIPTTGPISFSMLQTEFGGTNPISLSEYYAGGANVPSGTSGTNGAVPASGAISVSKFYGTSDVPPVQISDQFIVGAAPNGIEANASYTLLNNGQAQGADNVSGTYFLENWLISGSASAYEVRATLLSGDVPTIGVLNTWQSLSTGRVWGVAIVNGDMGSFLLIEIRNLSGTIIDSAQISLSAINTGGPGGPI